MRVKGGKLAAEEGEYKLEPKICCPHQEKEKSKAYTLLSKKKKELEAEEAEEKMLLELKRARDEV